MEFFKKKQEQPEVPALEEVQFEEDELFAEDLDKVIGGIPYEYAREQVEESELAKMFENVEQSVKEAESKQK